MPYVTAVADALEDVGAPFIFRQWTGIMAISGALERKVWSWTRRMRLYPNLYTVFVGPAGVGKTVCVNPLRKLWKHLNTVHIAASNVSRASVIDQLSRATRSFANANGPISFNSLLIASNELQVFLSAYESDFVGVLTDLYDNLIFEEEKRTRETKIDIENPQLVLLAATTPSYLNDLFSDRAWDQGFASRTIFIYSGEEVDVDIFNSSETSAEDDQDLIADLKSINCLYGQYLWDEDAQNAMRAWIKLGCPPKPAHPKLATYITRRRVQVLKLAMIAAASVSNELRVTLEHYQQALDWLFSAEHFMSDIFRASAGADQRVIEECWHFVMQMNIKDQRPHKSLVLRFITERSPIHSVTRIYEMMITAHWLKEYSEKGEITCQALAKPL